MLLCDCQLSEHHLRGYGPAMHPLYSWRMSLPKPMRSLWAAGKLLGVSGVQMHRYENGLRRVPPEKAAAYERITGIPREVLRPDIFGQPARRRSRKATDAAEALQAGE